jgi:hypothetical protein
MNKSEKDLERLESLLHRDSYASLSEEEQLFVLTQLHNEEEYERMRQITENLQQGLSSPLNLNPKPSLQATIHRQLAGRKVASRKVTHPVEPGNFRRLLSYRVPAYQVASGVGLLLGWLWFTNSRNNFRPEAPQPVALAPIRVDTVYQPTPPDTVLIEKRVLVQKQASQPADEPTSDASLTFIPASDDRMPVDSLGWLLEAKGTTMREDSTLSDLLVTDF